MAGIRKQRVDEFKAVQERADRDQAFARRLHDDPKGVLTAEGIAIEGLTFPGDHANDVSGYIYSDDDPMRNCRCILYCPFCGQCKVQLCD